MPSKFSYGKQEKLKSRKLIDQLFAGGKTFSVFPVKVFYLPVEEPLDNPVKAGVGVSTRHFKKAVDRNRIKRLLRESYRLEKQVLYDAVNTRQKRLAVFFLYIDKVKPEPALLQQKMPLILQKLIKALHENTAANT